MLSEIQLYYIQYKTTYAIVEYHIEKIEWNADVTDEWVIKEVCAQNNNKIKQQTIDTSSGFLFCSLSYNYIHSCLFVSNT